MNTVFKSGYQAFLLLGLAAGAALPWAAVWLPRILWPPWVAVMAVLLVLGLVYPYAGGYARTGGFANAPTLDGLKWLRTGSPGDPAAMEWIRANTAGDAVVLEAFGDDYSAFGHGRISTFTGLATVMGWQGHELQWQHDPGQRAADVKQLREITGAGMMDCKKALEEADGDVDAAIDILRTRGAAKAAKRGAEREASAGLVAHAPGAELGTQPIAVDELAQLLPDFELVRTTPTTLAGAAAQLFELTRRDALPA
jgi:hypothetical protein